MLARIDGFVLAKAQKFCDKFQRLTGLTKFRLEKWVHIFLVAVYWMFTINAFAPFLFLLASVFSFSEFFAIRRVEYREKNFLVHGELYFVVEQDFSFRIMIFGIHAGCLVFGLVASLFSPEWVWFCAWTIGAIAVLYLAVCTPRPTSKSKMREWLEKGLAKLNSLLPEPTPVPI